MILLDLNVIGPGAEVGQRIGNPQPMSVDSHTSLPAASRATRFGPHVASAEGASASRQAVAQGGIPAWVAARIPPPLGRQAGMKN